MLASFPLRINSFHKCMWERKRICLTFNPEFFLLREPCLPLLLSYAYGIMSYPECQDCLPSRVKDVAQSALVGEWSEKATLPFIICCWSAPLFWWPSLGTTSQYLGNHWPFEAELVFSLWSILAIPMTLWGEGFTTWLSHHPSDTQTESEALLGSVEATAGGGHDSGVLCLCCGCWKLPCCVPWQQSWCLGPVLWHYLGFMPGCMVPEPSSLEIIQVNPTSFLLTCKFSYDLKLTENLQEFASNPYIYIPIYSWFWFIF